MKYPEHAEQCSLFAWAKLQLKIYPELELLQSTQNGAKFTSVKAGKRAKNAGMLAGTPDILLPIARGRYNCLWIELKAPKPRGRLSDSQKHMLELLNKWGNKAVCCWGWLEAMKEIVKYLDGVIDETKA